MDNLDIADAPVLATGASGTVLLLSDTQVVKLFHADVSDEMIQREANVAAMAQAVSLPVAAPVREVRQQGRRGLVYPRLRGVTMLQAVRKALWRAPRLFDEMADLHVSIHSHAAREIRCVSTVLDTDIRYGPAPQHLQSAVLSHLRSLPAGDRLLHGDYHPGNIILTPQGPFIIDWAKAARGNAAADVVRTEMLLRFGQGKQDVLTNIWRDWAAARVRRRLIALGHVTQHDLDMWRPVVALAWLRARAPVRDTCFGRYLNRALAKAGLPPFT